MKKDVIITYLSNSTTDFFVIQSLLLGNELPVWVQETHTFCAFKMGLKAFLLILKKLVGINQVDQVIVNHSLSYVFIGTGC